MKVTIFNGSPNKGDSLSKITSSVAERMRAEGAAVKEYLLYFMDIKGCIDCGITRPDDEFKELIDELTSSDIVIFACPVYRWNISGALSAFIEELHSYCKYDDDLADSLGGRKASAVMVAESEENIAGEALEHLTAFFDKFRMEYAGAFVMPFSDKEKTADSCKSEIENFIEMIMKR